MNEINKQKRLRDASQMAAEAEKIKECPLFFWVLAVVKVPTTCFFVILESELGLGELLVSSSPGSEPFGSWPTGYDPVGTSPVDPFALVELPSGREGGRGPGRRGAAPGRRHRATAPGHHRWSQVPTCGPADRFWSSSPAVSVYFLIFCKVVKHF